MTATAPTAPTTPTPPAAAPEPAVAAGVSPRVEMDIVQEVRFAVVMYGGVSLAIYINGVTQELLHLVRATGFADGRDRQAGAHPSSALDPVERVYRKLAYLVGDEKLRQDYRECFTNGSTGTASKTREPRVAGLLSEDQPLCTRFIIDILSGTSAGGINAIFLAKALSNDKQIGGLTNMWMTEGDLASLINDRLSVSGLKNMAHDNPPRSLLNSRRMYYKLLAALQSVDGSTGASASATAKDPVGSKDSPSPYVDELDLYVTATDIRGVPLPLRLSDRVVYECRHRNVFQFRYASEASGKFHNDFTSEHSPFLAFAARCTSSFPFAFEPMCLADIDPIIPTFGYDAKLGSCNPAWERYFTDSLKARGVDGGVEFRHRAFGDGGYLDNKPFTYVTETVARRYSDVPVRRKLLYIEPSPQHPEDVRVEATRPSALENVIAALLDLPRQETIREDLQRLLDRNRLIERADRTLNQVRTDVAMANQSFEEDSRSFWPHEYLPDTIRRFGKSYLPYRRARIADTTDELARCLTSQAGFEVDSDEFLAIRAIVHVWRDRNYGDYREEGKPASANAFLDDFDLGFRVRRMNFIRRQIDILHRMTDSTKEELEREGKPSEIQTAYRHLKKRGFDYDGNSRARFKRALRELKEGLNRVERALQSASAALEAGTEAGAHTTAERPLFDAEIKALGLREVHLNYILGMEWKVEWKRDPRTDVATLEPMPGARFYRSVSNDDRNERARRLLETPGTFELPDTITKSYGDLAEKLKHYLTAAFDEAQKGCEELLDGFPEDALRTYLWREYLAFEDYDQVTFPILYGTDVGESEPVEVLRISPEDAVALINERKVGEGRRKLAGVTLFNFGGFLDQSWRQNDVLWGRLDGAERLITSVLPEPDDEAIRTDLISEAQLAILTEWAEAVGANTLGEFISSALMRARDASAERHLLSPSEPIAVRKAIADAVTTTLRGPKLLEFVRTSYEVDRRLDAEPLLNSISRATQVIGRIFEDIASRHSRQGRHLAWIARFGSVFWGLVQVAIPGSLGNLMFYHWFKLLLAFEAVVLATGWLLNERSAVRLGGLSLIFTALIGLTVSILRDQMSLKHRWLRGAVTMAALAVLFFMLAGIDRVFALEFGADLTTRFKEIASSLSLR